MECQDHGGYAVNVFSICVVSPSFSKYLLAPSLCWVLSGQWDVVVSVKTILPHGARILRREAQHKKMNRYLQSLSHGSGIMLGELKPDPIHEVWKGLTTKVPRTEQKRSFGLLSLSSQSFWLVLPSLYKG